MRRRPRSRIAVAVVLFAVFSTTACHPRFQAGASLTATELGSATRLDWEAATDFRGDDPVEYRVDVNGAEVARIDGSATSCELSGLQPLTTYDVAVTAYDIDGRWSGETESDGVVATTIATSEIAEPTSAISCEAPEPTLEQVLEVAPPGDAAAVESFLASEEGAPVDRAVTALDAVEFTPDTTCAAADAAIDEVLNTGFAASAALSPDALLEDAYWFLYATTLQVAERCATGATTIGVDGHAALATGLDLIAGRTDSLGAGSAATSEPHRASRDPLTDAGLAVTKTAAADAASNRPVWWALGDSFESGEGVPHVDPTTSGQGPDGTMCSRANGHPRNAGDPWSADKAYARATVAHKILFDATDAPFQFVACTGNITDDWSWQADQAAGWGTVGQQRPDVVSVGLGGNNLNFDGVLKNCLDLGRIAEVLGGPYANLLATAALGAEIRPDPGLGCDHTEAQLTNRVHLLTDPTGPGPFVGDVSFPQMLEQLALRVKPGGHLIVSGYPMLFEDPANWSRVNKFLHNCKGLWESDVRMIRNVQGRLNLELHNAVVNLRATHPGISVHWHDPSTVYESATGRHGLCARGDSWINGLSFENGRIESSFHPNQIGHIQTGVALANYLTANVGAANLKVRGESTEQLGPYGRLSAATLSSDGRFATFFASPSPEWLAEGTVQFLDRETHTSVEVGLSEDTSPQISTDGSTVVYRNASGVHSWRRDTGATTLIDNGVCFPNVIFDRCKTHVSGDGRFVAYAKSSTVYLWDRDSGARTSIAVGYNPDVSDDGRYVSFSSDEPFLVPEDDNSAATPADDFVWDRTTNVITRLPFIVTRNPATNAICDDGNFTNSASPRISGDGRYVTRAVYRAWPRPDNSCWHRSWRVIVWDRTTGEISEATGGTSNVGNEGPQSHGVDNGGSRIAFSSNAGFHTLDDTNGLWDVFVWDRDSSVTRRISDHADSSWVPEVSADGHHVSYVTRAADMSWLQFWSDGAP